MCTVLGQNKENPYQNLDVYAPLCFLNGFTPWNEVLQVVKLHQPAKKQHFLKVEGGCKLLKLTIK